MSELEQEAGLLKAIACLNFIIGTLVKSKEILEPKEIEGLVVILTDVFEILKGLKDLSQPQRVSP